jgi:ABC-type transport system substrate-binding protein
VLRRVGVALAATIAVTTVATSGTQASKVSASKYGGKIKVAIFDTFPGFCFGDNNANSALMVERTIYEGLFEKTIGGDMVGLLAESGTPSADLKTWTIKLRPNITFSDGAKFDADAVKLNLDYATGLKSTQTAQAAIPGIMASATFNGLVAALSAAPLSAVLPNLGLSVAALGTATGKQTLAFYAALGTFAKGGSIDTAVGGALNANSLTIAADAAWGATTFQLSTATAFYGNIKSISVVDPLTLKVDLVRAQNDFPNTLYASGRSFMRSPAQFINGKTVCSQKPIGTGPFKVADDYKLSNTDEMVVYKNTNYWRKDPVTKAKLPYLDQITFTNVKEGSQRAAAVRKGTYAAAMFSAASEASFIKDLRMRKSLVTEFKSKTEFFPSLWLNQGKAGSPFASKNARLAVLHCMDRANFVKVRTKGEGTVAKSLVGPSSIMYTTRGFQKFDVAGSKNYVAAWQAEAGNAGKTLEFTFPSDTSTASQANAKFYQLQWEKCGIKANITVEESAQIIAKTFNSSKSGAAQNAYDAIFILLLEGTDVSFNMPFMLSQAIETGSQAATWSSAVGTVLSLNHPSAAAAKTSDDALKAGEAATSPAVAKLKYQEAVAFLQTEGFMGSSAHFYYTFFANNKSGIAKSIGKLQLVKGKTQRIVTNWGIDWTGVHK